MKDMRLKLCLDTHIDGGAAQSNKAILCRSVSMIIVDTGNTHVIISSAAGRLVGTLGSAKTDNRDGVTSEAASVYISA